MQRERAWVEVDLGAITHNIRQIRGLLRPSTDLMAVVKADAYGHGAVTVAQAALQAGATWLGVATIPEGIELREAGITAPILLLGATNFPEQVRSLLRWQLQPTLCTPKQALIFAETVHQGQLPVHLKLDTGMSRLGTPWQDAQEFVDLVRCLPRLRLASVYSHFATADDPNPRMMRQQHQRFEQALQCCGIMPGSGLKLHFANSAAVLSDPALQYDLVRTGLAIYGFYPAPHLRHRVALKPALQVKARITQVKTIAAGTGVSYGHRFVADREMQLAVVGIGYADGVPRHLSNHLQVLLRGHLVRQIGAITMDQLMLDVSTIPDLQEGEVVTLLGRDGQAECSVETWAEQLGTISWEVLCGFKHRLPRVMIGHCLDDRPEVQSC
jgi:alanine racemase